MPDKKPQPAGAFPFGKPLSITRLEHIMKVYKQGGESAFDKEWARITSSHRDPEKDPPYPKEK